MSPGDTAPTADDVAAWMYQEISKRGVLYQDEAADHISANFGPQFTYENDNGGVAIARSVLDSFRRLTQDEVVWVRSERYWRHRAAEDEPGRQQE